MITTVEPGRSGRASAARPTSKAILTSMFHGAENDSQLCSSIGAISGRAPAATTTRSGSASARRAATCAGSVASRSRPAARTRAPVVARPTPLRAPMTRALWMLMVVLHALFAMEIRGAARIKRSRALDLCGHRGLKGKHRNERTSDECSDKGRDEMRRRLSGLMRRRTVVEPDRVVHLEPHTGDRAGASAFYGELCGWRPERIETAHGSYAWLALRDGMSGGIVECGVR